MLTPFVFRLTQKPMRKINSSRSRADNVDLPKMWFANTIHRRAKSSVLSHGTENVQHPSAFAIGANNAVAASSNSPSCSGAIRGIFVRISYPLVSVGVVSRPLHHVYCLRRLTLRQSLLKKLVIIYHSKTGNTKAMVEAVLNGARSPEITGVESRLLTAATAQPEDLLQAMA